jgi:hypothetical protein
MPEKIIVCCPGDIVTGGPELLHQLVTELRAFGKEAFISYYPFSKCFSTPQPYSHYDTPQKAIIDSPNVLIIFPETATHLIPKIRQARIGVWWLSVNNYLGKIHSSAAKNLLEDFYWRIKGKKSLNNMKCFLHFSQSYYAKNFLEEHGIHAEMLTDYLGRSHLNDNRPTHLRKNQVAYNPKKGFDKTRRLIRNHLDIPFVPIAGMSADEVRNLLEASKVYIDFGTHPGKDRFPREAAMAGCCIVTGVQGSAKNAQDIPIPRKYKLEDNSDHFLHEFRKTIGDIFENFENCTKEFESYRSSIQREPEIFREQIRKIFIETTSDKVAIN